KFVDAGVARLDHVIELSIASEHDDRHEWVGADGRGADQAHQFESVHAFEHPVDEDHIRIGFAGNGPGVLRIGGLVNLRGAERLRIVTTSLRICTLSSTTRSLKRSKR